MAGRKVLLCVKLFDFFVGEYLSVWLEICHVLSQIYWRFFCGISGKNYFGRIFCKFCQTKAISSTKTCEISPYFLQFLFWFRIAPKKFTQVLPYVVCTQVRRHANKRITKRRYREENPRPFVFGKPVLFTLCLGLTTPNSLGVLVWNFYQTFVTVSIEFRLRLEAQIRLTRLPINILLITARAERKVRLCVKLFDFFQWRILIRLTWKLSRFVPNSVEILTWNFRKRLFQYIFSKICVNQGYSLPKLVKFRPTFCNFYSGSVLHWKSSHKYFHMLFAPR